jgi:hypothetical protein
MKKLNTFGIEKAEQILRQGKFMVRAFNGAHASMGGVDTVLFGPSDVKYAKHFAEAGDVVFAFEHEVN